VFLLEGRLFPHPGNRSTRQHRWIKDERAEFSPRQTGHLERSNRKLNLALRLVRTFQKEDPLWDRPYNEQRAEFQAEYHKLKPLIDFFQ
jgi:hypothetical protein